MSYKILAKAIQNTPQAKMTFFSMRSLEQSIIVKIAAFATLLIEHTEGNTRFAIIPYSELSASDLCYLFSIIDKERDILRNVRLDLSSFEFFTQGSSSFPCLGFLVSRLLYPPLFCALSSLTNVTSLHLKFASLNCLTQEAIGYLTRLNKLNELTLEGGINGYDNRGLLILLNEFPLLQSLSLANMDCSNLTLNHLRNLKSLTLRKIKCSDFLLDSLKTHPKLRQLKIVDTQMTEKNFQSLGKLSTLFYLSLNHIDFDKHWIQYLGFLKQLQILNLENIPNFPHDPIVELLSKLSSLKELILQNGDLLYGKGMADYANQTYIPSPRLMPTYTSGYELD